MHIQHRFISAWTLHDNHKDGLSMSHASLLGPDRISKGVQCSTCTKTQKNIPRAPHILQLYTPIRLSCQQLHTLKGPAFNRLLRFVVRWWNAERCVLSTQSLSQYISLPISLSPALFPFTVLNYHSKWDLVFFLSPFSTQFNQVMKWLSDSPGQTVLGPWHFHRALLKCTRSWWFLL